MKAIVQDRYGATEVLQLKDVPEPVVGEGELLIRVRSAGVEPGVWHLMTGLPYVVRPMLGWTRPRVAVRGRDVAGVVEEVGPGVTRFRIGDEVYGVCEGSFAELAVAREGRLGHKPGNLEFVEAAVVPISATTALQALRDRGRVSPGDRVLVIGAGGGVGTFAVQIAKHLGAQVTGVCSTTKVELVRSLGADRVIDYTKEPLSGQYDLIIDCAGNRPLRVLRKLLTDTGQVVIIGGEGGGKWISPLDRVVPALVMSIITRQRFGLMLASERAEDLEALNGMIEAGAVRPFLDRTFDLVDAPAAIDYMVEGRVRGKVAVTVT